MNNQVEQIRAEIERQKNVFRPSIASIYGNSAKVVLQLGEREYNEAALVKIAKDVWKFDLGKNPADLKKIELYIKPEENKVYYVMNGESGDFNI